MGEALKRFKTWAMETLASCGAKGKTLQKIQNLRYGYYPAPGTALNKAKTWAVRIPSRLHLGYGNPRLLLGKALQNDILV